MNYEDLTHYWINKHNEKYYEYLKSIEEPRYSVKTFFLNSYRLFKTLGKEWEDYLEGYSALFRRDPANDYYKYRDPTQESVERRNSLEWTTAFEIVAAVGFPHNESAKRDFIKYSREFLEKAMKSPNSMWVDFMLSSAVAHLPNVYADVEKWFPSQLEKYIQNEDVGPNQLIMYLKALSKYEGQTELRAKILSKLMEWIQNPVGTSNKQVLVWARLITSMQWLEDLKKPEIKEILISNFVRALNAVYQVDWANSPIFLEAFYLITDEAKRIDMQKILVNRLTPSSFLKFQELFPFLDLDDEALEVKDTVIQVKEKCKACVSQVECENCIKNKQGDCWIRILAKLTNTSPKLHSGYEVADKVIYRLQQGVYVVIKATPIAKMTGEGDVLFRQCCSLFSIDHALVLYLNSFETAPTVIEEIKKVASNSIKNPRFEVIDHKYIRQIYKKYLRSEQ